MNSLKYPFLDLGAVNAPYIEALNEAAVGSIASGRYIGGESVEQLNNNLASLCHAPHAIGVSNGLDALRLILEGYKILGMLHEGDEIIVAANTYIASILAIIHAGLKPVLTDPDPSTLNLSADGIERSLTNRTKAVMTVDLYGRIDWNENIRSIIADRNLLVVEDAAQAIGAQSSSDGLFDSRFAGAVGHAGALSFYPTKNVGALGDAGAVITHSKDLADAVRALANYGSDRRYHNLYCGFNCRIDPIQAAFLNIKLKDLEQISERRRQKAEVYSNAISNPLISKPDHPTDRLESVWHQYVVRLPETDRMRFIDHLSANGIGSDIHYPTPPHMQPALSDRFAGCSFPEAQRLAAQCVSLPMADNLTISDIRQISTIINSFK